jgi:hypothetical protein
MGVIRERTIPAARPACKIAGDSLSIRRPPSWAKARAGNAGNAAPELIPIESSTGPSPWDVDGDRRPGETSSSPSHNVFRLADRSRSSILPENQAVLDHFTDLWNRGEMPGAEAYLQRLGQVAPRLAVELIYREYCLEELAGRHPQASVILQRFPQYRQSLEPLLAVHRHCSLSELNGWIEPARAEVTLPEAGDEIGPYMLRRELGRGAFARVFLAEQADLEYRQVVVKVSMRPTREPWLLARVRHAYIVEILSHAEVDDGAFQLICMPFLGGATFSALLAHRRQVRRHSGARGDILKHLDAVAAAEFDGVNPARPARELLGRLSDRQAMAWIVARLAEALDHAFARDVAHGDVKPSNILLTADGNPMLLDFNLAQDWSPRDDERPLDDPGGTLAYMAPERLTGFRQYPVGSFDRVSTYEFTEVAWH